MTKSRWIRWVIQSADKSLARPGRKQANVSVRMAWISFGAFPYRKRNLMTARVSILLKSRASLTFFRACFLPGRAKDLSAPRYLWDVQIYRTRLKNRWYACPKCQVERFPGHAAFTAVPVIFPFLYPTTVSILWNICMCIYTHIWLRRDCIWITVATK